MPAWGIPTIIKKMDLSRFQMLFCRSSHLGFTQPPNDVRVTVFYPLHTQPQAGSMIPSTDATWQF